MKKILFTTALILAFTTVFGCFIMFITDGRNILIANHEDWYARDAEVTFVPAKANKFGMVYFDFISEKLAQGGMNTEGLFFDGTRTPNAPYEENATKKNCHCYIWTKILEECKTVDEAITYVQRYRVEEIEDIHVMFADRTGNSAVVGIYDHQLQVHRRKGSYQLLTNFNLANPSYGGEERCLRYAAADSMLKEDSSATINNIEKILRKTNQEELTVYSNIYNLTTGEVYVYGVDSRENFTKKIKLTLKNELKKGRHSISIRNLIK